MPGETWSPENGAILHYDTSSKPGYYARALNRQVVSLTRVAWEEMTDLERQGRVVVLGWGDAILVAASAERAASGS